MSGYLDLNKFEKQEEIGHGAFGHVFKTLEKGTKNIYAAKISNTKLNKDDIKSITNIKHEVGIFSQLCHPSVLKFIGYCPFDFDQNPYPVIITEYSPNGSLNDIIKLDRKLSAPKLWTDTKKLINIYGIASAMSYLHSHDIVHRDLKPANILEDVNLFPKIADFGLSKQNLNEKSTIEFKGTPIYIAPEIWKDYKYSKPGDVYAFAFVVYEILTLDEPFKNYNYYSLCSKVAINNERPVFKYPIPVCYRNLINRCWSVDPKNRPTFQDIVIELRTNKNFIIDSINEEEFSSYVDFVDNLGHSFNPDKKLDTILLIPKNKENSEGENHKEKICEDEKEEKSQEENDAFSKCSWLSKYEKEEKSQEENDEKIITIEAFNSLPLKTQYFEITKFIESQHNNFNKEHLISLKKLIEYIIEAKKETETRNHSKYFNIITNDKETTIEELTEETIEISLSYSLFENNNEFNQEKTIIQQFINKFKRIYIDIEYPMKTSDFIYDKILRIKKANKNEIIGGKIGFKNVGGGSFSGCYKIKHISIPSTVTSIGNYSFCGCSSITRIKIQSSVKVIHEGVFSGCLSLKRIKIPSSVTSIESNAFFGCFSLVKVSFNTPSSVTEIGEYSFYGCKSLSEISIPSSVTKIKDYAFDDCLSLKQILLPSSLSEIGTNVFNKCKEIILSNGTKSIIANTFNGCLSLISIIIPSTVTSIENHSFYMNLALKEIIIPSSVTKIGQYAFSLCKSLSKITFESQSSLELIDDFAFSECSSLLQIIIPSSIEKIGYGAFKMCSSLTQITIQSSNKINEELDILSIFSFTKQITNPSQKQIIGPYAFSECSSLTQIIISSSIKTIGEHAFSNCSSLKEITIPSLVNDIRSDAFINCVSLSQVTFEAPFSIDSIGFFSNCYSLIEIHIPNSVHKINYNAFSECSSLTQITIPSSVFSIGNCAFYRCSSLKQITIPSSVTSIGDSAFSECSSLTQITIPSSIIHIGEYAFSECFSLEEITLENRSKLKVIESYVFSECLSLTEIEIPQSVKLIKYHAFYKCESLKDIQIPSCYVEIEKDAFSECPLLTTKIESFNNYFM